jgi:AcrR family transcriptional regulator
MSTRPRGRPRTFDRDEALCRAIEVFQRHGYDGATLEDLLAAMGGISPPSFYAAFGSKERLFEEALERYRTTVGMRPQRALAAPRVRDAIQGMLREAVEVFANPAGAGGCMVVLGAVHDTRANKDVHDRLREMRLQMPRTIQDRIEQAVADGELPAGVDAAGLAVFYATVLQGLAIRARDGAPLPALLAAADGAMAAWEPLTARATPGRRGGARAATRAQAHPVPRSPRRPSARR